MPPNSTPAIPSSSRRTTTTSLRPTSSNIPTKEHTPQEPDESPFINPPSPTLKPALGPFMGDASMHLGAHTFIQALQALPWAYPDGDGDEDGEGAGYELGRVGEESSDDYEEEEDEHDIHGVDRLSSSIHAIHRPLARSRRLFPPNTADGGGGHSPLIEEGESEDEGQEEQESERQERGQDFEDEDPEAEEEKEKSTPRIDQPLQGRGVGRIQSLEMFKSTFSPRSAVDDNEARSPSTVVPRQGSMGTIKAHRRELLAEKLRDVFDVDGITEVRAEMSCWLMRSILLQGYMYLTNSYICFFAHLPSKEDQVIKSGSLSKRTQKTKRWLKHWFVLKNDALSWYPSASDPYFPHGIVDLRYAISCEPQGEMDFCLRTHQKTVTLVADSVPSRNEWVKVIRKVMFKAQNSGESVKIAIPYSAILDIEKSTAMDFSETIEIQVVDKDDEDTGGHDHFSIDSYFFAYFHDLPGALEKIRDAVRMGDLNRADMRGDGANLRVSPEPALIDTTVSRVAHERPELGSAAAKAASSPNISSTPATGGGFRFSSLLRPLALARSSTSANATTLSPIPSSNSTSPSEQRPGEGYTYISQPQSSSSFVPVTLSPEPQLAGEGRLSPSPTVHGSPPPPSGSSPPVRRHQRPDHKYPPSTSSSWISAPSLSRHSSTSSWLGMPSWLSKGSRRVLGVAGYAGDEGIKETYSGFSVSSSSANRHMSGAGDMAYSIMLTPGVAVDPEVAAKFHTAFAYDEKETLLGYFPGYLYRLLPLYGKLYISKNYFCFRSTGHLYKRTQMTLPVRDILAVEKSKAPRFGYYGLVIIVKGHEELFFEFGDQGKREAFVLLLDHQMENILKEQSLSAKSQPSPGKREALMLQDLDVGVSDDNSLIDSTPPPGLEDYTFDSSVPAAMFTSTSSTFLTFKPEKSLHFTFLTIGSRGDVQPYIALSKGLMAEGHRCRIATHAEYKEWVESNGIEFAVIGGDPAELMRLCIENGMFTVSFLREGLQKFRGWLDDLLQSSWDACQGTDVLIESPSAMGGYHIAEALSIPYFRAFTMTWSRTRAYPHATAVPERKMGGGYNYMSYVMFDQVFWRATAGQINRWRKKVLNLEPTSLDKMDPHKIPFLYNFSPFVVPPPLDWPEWIRVTGYWFLDSAEVSSKAWTPPDDLVKFIDNARSLGKKIIYIGFGSILVSDGEAMTRCIVESVIRSGVHAILSKGWSERLSSDDGGSHSSKPIELPPQIYSLNSVPHDWLFPRIDAACHHGGAGTTGASLRAGIPTIIRPFFGDQFFWGDRVEALGVGTCIKKLTTSSLTEAMISATTNTKQIARAKLLGERISGEDGVATAIKAIYRDLEYARSLIKRNRRANPNIDLNSNTEHSNNALLSTSGSQISSSSSRRSSSGSLRRTLSEEWSVISDQDDHRSSLSSPNPERQSTTSNRSIKHGVTV